jgi:ABC-type microcin C transport system duplicated ATPase subunit YejF
MRDESLVMREGRVVEQGPTTRALMAAAFELETFEEGGLRT